MNILLVEDEPLIQKTLKLLFTKKGAKVTATSSGHEAIKYILSQDFDIIVCDLMLQDITGFDVIEEAKKRLDPDQISKKFKIITAYSSIQILERIKKYNCSIYSKPFADVNLIIDNIMSEPK